METKKEEIIQRIIKKYENNADCLKGCEKNCTILTSEIKSTVKAYSESERIDIFKDINEKIDEYKSESLLEYNGESDKSYIKEKDIESLEHFIKYLWLFIYRDIKLWLEPKKIISTPSSLTIKPKEKVSFVVNQELDDYILEYFSGNRDMYKVLNEVYGTIKSHSTNIKEIKTEELSEDELKSLTAGIDDFCSWQILKVQYKSIGKAIANSEKILYWFKKNIQKKAAKNRFRTRVVEITEARLKELEKELFNESQVLYEQIKRKIDSLEYISVSEFEKGAHKYKISPQLAFVFFISTMASLIQAVLNKKNKNIFYEIGDRKASLTEELINKRIKRDKENYLLVYAHVRTPGKRTFEKEKERLEKWFEEITKLQFGNLNELVNNILLSNGISIQTEEKFLPSVQ